MPVAAGVEGVLRVVRVDEVDAAGDRSNPLDQVDQLLTAGVRVARVEAEARAKLSDRVPQPRDLVELAGAGVVAAGGVLDQYRQREATRLGRAAEHLAPVVEADRR